ncbi:hypothetical protein [Flammeovirga kamogawensis]|uniref:Uncharacterized protein n=1 Tax=Flammeovirga kamogawensis TaxID=373891 RepID=A0ABX8GSM0_9BACT|nr:hypothetical protein [Flammeovirga kamogawensis]MBB6463906.1 hypothetical protein [Flammeovirga kamogawensis]QWG06570.1 hypothetical protein KM029_14760 [Flammeovirga kamogawensis]TRX68396.1 hypothetical protein EO216_09760 [Flammeovirga kamogawensis]
MKFKTIISSLIISFIFLMNMSVYGQNESIKITKNNTNSMLEYYALNNTDEAWEKNPFFLYFSPQENITGEEFSKLKGDVDNWIADWKIKKASSNKSILKKIFTKTRAKYLVNYNECSTFSLLLKNGTYDCLTGTLLFAHILKELDYEYEIKQLNSHVYIMVNDPQLGITLIESTDVYGYINGKHAIANKVEGYQKRLDNSLLYVKYGLDLKEDLTIKDIAGLQYYNKAVAAFRVNDLSAARLSLYKASIITDSPRISFLEEYLNESSVVVSAAK